MTAPTLRTDQQAPDPLRPYQRAMFDATLAHFRAGLRAVLNIAPTGSGKGTLIAEWLHHATAHGRPVLFGVHLSEIALDVRDRAIAAGVPASDIRVVMGAHTEGREDALLTIASWQTAAARALTVPNCALVLADEAHRTKASTVLATLERHSAARLVGFTATGQRGDGSGLGSVGYQAIVQGPSIAELVAMGYLAPVRLIAPDDYCDALAWDPADVWVRWSEGRPGVVFASSIPHSQEIAAALRSRGLRAVHIDSDTPKRQREPAVAALESGDIDVLCNFRLFVEGVNVPRAAVCMLATAFSYDGPYLQAVGRVRRPHPDKPYATVLDLRGNWARRGHMDAPRVYSLTGEGCRSVMEPLPSVRQCPACLSWVDGTPCPYCGAATAEGRRPVRVVKAELHEQTAAREAARIARQDGLARSGPDWDLFLELVERQHRKGKAHTAAFLFIKQRGRAPRWRVEHALAAIQARGDKKGAA